MRKMIIGANNKSKKVCCIAIAVILTVTGLTVEPTANKAYAAQNEEVNQNLLPENADVEIDENAKDLSVAQTEAQSGKEESKNAVVVREIEELRGSNSTTYLLSDGSRQLELYGENIRFWQDGRYVDYDTTLKETNSESIKSISKMLNDNGVTASDYLYENTCGDSKIYLPDSLGGNSAIALAKEDKLIAFSPICVANDEIEIKNGPAGANTIIYGNADDTISYKYTALNNGLKEELVLNEKPEDNCFEFALSLPGMEIQNNEYSDEIRIVDSTSKELVAYIEKPYIIENNNILYDKVYCETEKSGDTYIFSIVVDEDYLDSDNTLYPITIDPTVCWTSSVLESASVTNFQYTLNTNLKHTNTIRVHNDGMRDYPPYIGSYQMAYIDTSGIDLNNGFGGSAETFYGSIVENAYLDIYEQSTAYPVGMNYTSYFNLGTVEVRTPVNTWNPNTITWNNHPNVGSYVWSSFACTGVTGTKHRIYLTDWAQAIANREINNTGLALKAVEENTGINFYSSASTGYGYNMSLNITYRNPNTGGKDIYSYESFETPNGNGEIELEQGNLYYVQNDFSLPTPQLNLGVTRYYNSGILEKSAFGKGWRCEYDANVKSKNNSSFTYIDGTGAFYVFNRQQDGSYLCNENPDLTGEMGTETQIRIIAAYNNEQSRTVSFDSYYVIQDKDYVKYYFDNIGRLRLIEEENDTFLYLQYHSTYGMLQSVTYSNGQSIAFTYSGFGGEYYISRIDLADGSYFSYAYSNDRLITVTHTGTNNHQIEYSYEYNNAGKMCTITDAMGNDYQIGYDGSSVESVVYPNGDETDIYTAFQPNKTRVIHKNIPGTVLRYEDYEFDGYGKVLSVTNDKGDVSTYTYDGCLITESSEKIEYHKLQNGTVVTIDTEGNGEDSCLTESTEYNSRNNVISETDNEGNVTEYTYGNSDYPDLVTYEKTINPDEETVSEIRYEYDSNGNLKKEIDCIEKTVTTYTYDSKGNVTEDTETLVNSNTNMNSITDNTISMGLNNYTDTATYNVDGNNLTGSTVSGTLNTSEENTYDVLGRISTSEDERGIITSYTYDEFGRIITTTVTYPNNVVENTYVSYDLNGRTVSETDKAGRITSYTYDNVGRVTAQTVSYGNESKTQTTTYGYETNVFIMTRLSGGRLVPVVSTVTVRNANNVVVSKEYIDPYGESVRKEANGIRTDYTYDKQGNVYTTYTKGVENTNVASPKFTVYVYDKYGRLTDTIINPDYTNGEFCVNQNSSIVTSKNYDVNGNVTEEIDAKGNSTEYEYDEEGRITKVCLPAAAGNTNETIYSYGVQILDNDNKIIAIKDITENALGNISESVQNGAGQLLTVTDKAQAGDIVVSYQYDIRGNVTRENHSNGSYITYNYNNKNLLISKSEYSGYNSWTKLETYTYNSEDVLVSVCDYKVTGYTPTPYHYTYYEYDNFNRVIGVSEINATSTPSSTVIDNNKLTYEYDIEDRLVEIRYPSTSGESLKGVVYEYNSYNWLTKISGIIEDNGIEDYSDIREYEYYNDSKVKTIKDYIGFMSGSGNYINKTYQYDALDRVTDISIANSSNLNLVLEEHFYGYDKNNNITYEGIINNYPANQADKVNERRYYTYDNLNRLVSTLINDYITNTFSSTTYTYDKVGNRTKIEDYATATEYVYNELNQLVSSETYNKSPRTTTSDVTYTYDASGNLVSESDSISGEIITYQYDALNHLTGSTKTVSGITQYTQSNTYDYRGKRISKTDDGATTSYFYQNDTLLYTKDGSGNKTSQNIIGPEGNIIATVHFDNGEHAFFYNKDIRTSVISVVDESGSCAASYKYDDFGTISKPQNQNFYNEICYTSGVYDELTGKYYLNARYYNPATAMFLTQDSYRGETGDYTTWNMYAYCAGNPITYTDPSGCFAVTATFVTYFTFDAVVSLGLYCMCVDAVNKTYEVRNSYNVVLDRNLNEYALSQKYNIDKTGKKVYKKKKLTLSYSKSMTYVKTKGNENMRDTGLVGVSDQELLAKLRDPHIPKKEKNRIQREQKARSQRNKSKNRGKNKSK